MRGAGVLSLLFTSLVMAEGFVPRLSELESPESDGRIPIPDEVLEYQRRHPESASGRHHHHHHHH